jgi:hypothetical protein
MSEHDPQAPDLGRVAYEARFRGMTLGPRGVAPAWADLGPDGQAVWQRVADEVVAAARWRSPAAEHLRTFRDLLASLAWDALRLVGLDNPSSRRGQFLLPYAGDWTYRRERREALREMAEGSRRG